MAVDGEQPTFEEPDKRWESFSNYGDVAQDVHAAVIGAIEAQSMIHGMHSNGANVKPDLGAEASATIMAAAKRLLTEMRREQDGANGDVYSEILERWEGDEGFIQRLANVDLTVVSPGFLHQFVEDIHQAAFELGYLRAGRELREDLDNKHENDAQNMFSEL